MVVLNVEWLNQLNTKKVILASTSPRRREIMDHLAINYRIVATTFEENLDKALFPHPTDYVKENALQKALEVYSRLKANGESPDLVIGADTVVALGPKILEKPRSVQGAIDMLTSLSGSTHMVYTGVALIAPPVDGSDKPRILVDVEGTEVKMQVLTKELIEAYVATGEPMDKAGAYGYQTTGCLLVKGINGCSWNVIGLPASKLFFMLQKFMA
ncbi:septum formation protein [Entomortierella parvispora]|uniref:Septum formation protein n=1 Tax=Entomortierella parvispora TaxID=205924 RepID=A0A9P3HGY0_9FUNG|nr:septum formation protein [Entomortierella parvispora]